MTAYSEVKILELSAMTFNSLDGAESTYQLLIFSWFGFYAGSRGLITTIESALFSLSFCKLAVRYLKIEVKILMFTICLKQFINVIQENSPKSSSVEYLVYAGISIFSRLSGTMIYLVLFLFNFHYCQNKPKVNKIWGSYSKYKICIFQLVAKAVQLAILIFGLGLIFDLCWFGYYTVTPLNFVKVNVFDGIANFYGQGKGDLTFLSPTLSGLCKLRHRKIVVVIL